MNEEQGLSIKDYINKVLQDTQKAFYELTKWSERECAEYQALLSKLDASHVDSATSREQGDALESVVTFIFTHSSIFEIYCNARTATNEIDHVITLSNQGKFLLSESMINISDFGLESDDDVIISECKNYTKPADVTNIGKFYALMQSLDVKFGLFFSYKGITGKENSYADAYGLIKVIRLAEKYKNRRELYIIPINADDLRSITCATDFYKLIQSKKLSLRISAVENALRSSKHENASLLTIKLNELRS